MLFTGSCLVLLWRMTAFVLTLAMVCNLRAHLMRPVTEKPINNANDILERGKNLWVGKVPTIDNYYSKYLPSFIVDYVEKRQTKYDILPNDVPVNIWQDVIENGAVVLDYRVTLKK